MNESHWHHFCGAFVYAIALKHFVFNQPDMAFVITLIGGILIEARQLRRAIRVDLAYVVDTGFDIVADVAGAAAACFLAWC